MWLIKRSIFTTSKDHFQRRIVGYSPSQMYALVANVDQYDQFVPWCVQSVVLSKNTTQDNTVQLKAQLTVGFQSLLKESYISQVICVPNKSVIVRSV